jgi:hypothetical protein
MGPSSQIPALFDEHVEATVPGQPPGQRLPVVHVGDVAGHHLDPLAALAGQLVQQVGAAGGGQHVRARLVQHAGEPRAQARRGTGHQRDPVVQPPLRGGTAAGCHGDSDTGCVRHGGAPTDVR